MCNDIKTDNRIGDEGCRMISEALKENSSLTYLSLDSQEKEDKRMKRGEMRYIIDE